jgi:hypothetical protein
MGTEILEDDDRPFLDMALDPRNHLDLPEQEVAQLFAEQDTVTRILERTAAIKAADADCDKILAAATAEVGIPCFSSPAPSEDTLLLFSYVLKPDGRDMLPRAKPQIIL